MVRIGTPINKPTPATVYSHQLPSFFFPSLFPFPLPPLFRLAFSSHASVRCSTNVQGKPINHRIPRVYCGTPLCRTSNKSSLLLYPASRPSVEQTFATFANYWPVLTRVHASKGSKVNIGRKESETRLRAPSSFRLVVLPRVYRRQGGRTPPSYAGESLEGIDKIILLPKRPNFSPNTRRFLLVQSFTSWILLVGE